MDDSVPAPPKRHVRLRSTVVFGLLLITIAAFLCYGQLPEPGQERKPAWVERWVFWMEATEPEREPDVIFVPTPQEAVDRMLEVADIKPGDVLYDLGCGDGRIVATAARKYGIRAVGVDIDPLRVAEARRTVRTNGVSHLVTIRKADIFELDFSEATVVTLYLLPELNVRLMPKLAQLKPGTRIISFEFDMRGAKPQQLVEIDLNKPGASLPEPPRRIYRWTVPWEPE
jgi:SAM-dependent methyltransferase